MKFLNETAFYTAVKNGNAEIVSCLLSNDKVDFNLSYILHIFL